MTLKNKKIKDESDFLRSLIRQAGYRATPTRLALLSLLRKNQKPLSIQDMMKRLGDTRIDQATIYRTLNALKKEDIIRQIDLYHGHAHYELVNALDHHHLVCEKCNRIEDFIGCGFKQIAKNVAKKNPTFAKVNHHSFELFGVCKKCNKGLSPKNYDYF